MNYYNFLNIEVYIIRHSCLPIHTRVPWTLIATTNDELSKDRYIFSKDVGTKGNRFAIFTQISIITTTNYWGIYFYQKYKKG